MATSINKSKKARKHPQGDPSIARAPSERWQRGAEAEEAVVEDGGRRVQRVLTGLAQLHREGRIAPADVTSALRWRRDYESGILGASDPEQSGHSGSAGVEAWMAASVDAVTRYRQAARAVGPRGEAILIAYVSEGMSITAMSAAGGGDRRALATALADTLGALTAHYTELQRAYQATRSALRASAVDGDRDGEKAVRRHVEALGMRGMAPEQAVAIVRARLAARLPSGGTRVSA